MKAADFRDIVTMGVPVPDGEWERFIAEASEESFEQGDFLAREGQPVDCLYYLVRGIVRYFARAPRVDRGRRRNKADEVTFGFDYEGRFVTDAEGFYVEGASRTSIEALEAVDAIALRRDAILAAYERHPCWERIGRLHAELVVRRSRDKEWRIRMLSAEERYRRLVDEQSPLALRLPQFHLASYLGIAPETLSRIRGRV